MNKVEKSRKRQKLSTAPRIALTDIQREAVALMHVYENETVDINYTLARYQVSVSLKPRMAMLNLRVGFGKTFVALERIRQLFVENPRACILVVIPYALIHQWCESLEAFFTPDELKKTKVLRSQAALPVFSNGPSEIVNPLQVPGVAWFMTNTVHQKLAYAMPRQANDQCYRSNNFSSVLFDLAIFDEVCPREMWREKATRCDFRFAWLLSATARELPYVQPMPIRTSSQKTALAVASQREGYG